jgi:DNA-binding PadR family transcriptional regulator
VRLTLQAMSSASTTRLLVLGVVRILQPVHGYDARRELLSWRADEWANVAPGSIYNQLKTLAADGLLEVTATESQGGRPARTVYRVTADGESEFTQMLRETWWNLNTSPGSILAAACFLPHMTRDELTAALEHRIALLRSAQGGIKFSVKELPSPGTPGHVAEVLRLSASYLGGEVAWATELLGRLRSGHYLLKGEFDDPAELMGPQNV